MEVRRFVVSPLRSNCYVLSESLRPGSPAVIIDPGYDELEGVFEYIEQHGLRVVANWNTHAHFDHVLGVDLVRDKYHCPAYVHKADADIWARTPLNAMRWIGKECALLRTPDGYLADGDVLTLGSEAFTVWHTPGHSPGGVCFVGTSLAVTGDTLFKGTVGRTDLEESSPEAMEASLERILAWDDELLLYPGHGDETTMSEEREKNRFLRIAARGGR
ncbi:MBL fold metallo-hydrolase [Alicyclobacillus fastidiosus]|uniref:MBL fold metallo-hydrolase n=1 Tax=Alicyclobacillus fastidiosus TaxID=392011 RepID=A0ABY6ZL72_9BACL|nr:MBL fold metallo-hydrolase [Alicyclobacillus fastidiosus]WAH43652.1 MBL fold metallo-hydrolase [Alicyclobacillus fastidiosus]GMA59851.1 MBL fold hydrolase [Alicyclobacillus fastidiosus]